MIDGVIQRYNCSYFFLNKKHFCLKCEEPLVKKRREVIVNSESKEASEYDFMVSDMILSGNIKFITFYFECPKCKAVYEIHELKQLKKGLKKTKKHGSFCIFYDFNRRR